MKEKYRKTKGGSCIYWFIPQRMGTARARPGQSPEPRSFHIGGWEHALELVLLPLRVCRSRKLESEAEAELEGRCPDLGCWLPKQCLAWLVTRPEGQYLEHKL